MQESTLVGFAQSGEEWALAELYRRYSRAAFKSAYLMLGSRPLAEDALQETFVQVIRKIRSLREPDRFRPWLWRILTREVSHMKRKSVWSSWSPLRNEESRHPWPSAIDLVMESEEIAELHQAIQRLKLPHRIPVVLRYFDELSEQEIAQVLDVPIGTVKSRLHHARQTLQRMMSRPLPFKGKEVMNHDG